MSMKPLRQIITYQQEEEADTPGTALLLPWRQREWERAKGEHEAFRDEQKERSHVR